MTKVEKEMTRECYRDSRGREKMRIAFSHVLSYLEHV